MKRGMCFRRPHGGDKYEHLGWLTPYWRTMYLYLSHNVAPFGPSCTVDVRDCGGDGGSGGIILKTNSCSSSGSSNNVIG